MVRARETAFLVNRRVRLSGDPGLATKLRVEIRQGAGARHQPVATLDHAVGIGTDQRQLARLETFKQAAVVLGLLCFIIKETGTQNRLGSAWFSQVDIKAVDQGDVAFRDRENRSVAGFP